jgi:ELWxxDGT repeat protein
VHGEELWTSDGTAAGTTLLEDIYPGPAGSNIQNMIPVGSRVFFTATSPDLGSGLWRSDGTDSFTWGRDLPPVTIAPAPEYLSYDGIATISFVTIDPTSGSSTLWQIHRNPGLNSAVSAAPGNGAMVAGAWNWNLNPGPGSAVPEAVWSDATAPADFVTAGLTPGWVDPWHPNRHPGSSS